MDWFLVWLDRYELMIELIITIVTIMLSLYAVFQTRNIAIKQLEQEDNIAKQQAELQKKQIDQELLLNCKQEALQKRQIRIETFDYKSNIYHALYKVFKMSATIQYNIYDIIGIKSLSEKTCEQLFGLFNASIEVDKIVPSEVLWLFKQAEYIYPDNIYPSIKAISKDFDELAGNIGKFNLYPKILTENELKEEKKKLLEDIYTRVKNINSHVTFIESIIPHELNISNLEK